MRKMSLSVIVLTSLLGVGAAASQSGELTQEEVNGLIGSVQKCWNPPTATAGKVTVRFKLDRSGAVVGTPQTSGGQTTGEGADLLAAAARRAVLRCQPYALPAEKYESWSEVTVNFATE